MAQGDTPITVVGNLVADPELRFTPNGTQVANFRVASTPRRWDPQTNSFVDGEALFLTCNLWRQAAENASESLKKGMRVIISGRLKQRSWQTQTGERRTVFEVEVDEVGPSLRNATAVVTRTQPAGGGGSAPGQQGGYGAGGYGQQQPPQQAAPQGGSNPPAPAGGGPVPDPWNSAPQQQSGGFGEAGDNVPF